MLLNLICVVCYTCCVGMPSYLSPIRVKTRTLFVTSARNERRIRSDRGNAYRSGHLFATHLDTQYSQARELAMSGVRTSLATRPIVLRRFARIIVFYLLSVHCDQAAAAPIPVIYINVDRIVTSVSPLHAGLMTEEINHSYDGGLYAELIRDRAMGGGIMPKVGALGAWTLIGNVGSGLALDVANSLNEAIPGSLRIDAPTASTSHRVGVANEGYWGIAVRPNTRYRVSFYAKAAEGFTGPLRVSIERKGEPADLAHVDLALSASGEWKKYDAVMTTGSALPVSADTRLVIVTEHPGTFWVTLVSLFPPTWKDRPNGNRIDLMQKLADMHPRFLRFPGGAYLEGATIDNRYDWKKTIGPLSGRTGHSSIWGYWSSDGLGYLEFLEWCEDLEIQPVLGVYAGYSGNAEEIPAGATLQPFVQDALDEIEYATGDTTTIWGKRRAQDGHPAAFNIPFVEIGNEDIGPNYEERFTQFYDAIKSR